MKIYIANESKQSLGGGFTFLRTFQKYASKSPDVEFVNWELAKKFKEYNEQVIFFISGATMVKREHVIEARDLGMKIVLRVDNIPRNSRNRNTGTSRLFDFAQLADLVIYQSEWAKNYIKPFIKKDGPVILNGADEEYFNIEGLRQPHEGSPQYLYMQYNRDETKRWHEAWYEYQMRQRQFPDAHLWIIGNFSEENLQYNFDFYMGEKFKYIGVLDNPADLAEYYRGTDTLLLPYYNDACSNTLIEARLCGVKNIVCNETGGNKEILEADVSKLTATYMTYLYLMELNKIV